MPPLSPTSSVIVSSILAYLIGGLPFGYWFVQSSSGQDLRTMGSGNIGATNVHRNLGYKAGIAVLALDILKGFLAAWLAALIAPGRPLVLACAALAVMLGHCYPVVLRFKGGKAVACFVGAFAFIAPLPLAATLAVFLLVVAFARYVSLASIVAVWLFPLLFWFLSHPPLPLIVASILAAMLITYRHKGNISRLRSGAEDPFSLKRARAATDQFPQRAAK